MFDVAPMPVLEPAPAYKLQMAPLRPTHAVEKTMVLPGLSQQLPAEASRRHRHHGSHSRVVSSIFNKQAGTRC